MRPRIRPLSNLWFRWGRSAGLEAEEVASRLEAAGLILRVGPGAYREVERPRVPRLEFESLVASALRKEKSHE